MFNKAKTMLAGLGVTLVALLSAGLVWAMEPGPSDAFTTGPSATCHVTDGMFTDCDADKPKEWSDIRASFFDVFAEVPGPESALYVDQADLRPDMETPKSEVDTLMLMYDEMLRTTPLGPSETVHVHFMTVDEGMLVHYDVWIGTSGIQRVEINGVPQVPMPSGLTGIAGYSTSPNSTTPHVMAELQIGLEAAGFTSDECCYSPDPAWWGSDVPENPRGGCPDDSDCDGIPDRDDPCPGTPGINCQPNPSCSPEDVDCDGFPNEDDACPFEPGVPEHKGCPPPQEEPRPVATTAGIFTAHLNGKTTVDPEPLMSPGEEPPLCESIRRIVEFRTEPGTVETELLALQLVGSQVEAGIITHDEALELLRCVLGAPVSHEGRMTGGGSVFTKDGMRVTHGFELHCDAADLPNRLQVNWGKGNRFHLKSMTGALCLDLPTVTPNPPAAGFDVHVGTGTGQYNGQPGAIAKWKIVDAGEPGTSDALALSIVDSNGNPVLSVAGSLDRGNHQAHAQ